MGLICWETSLTSLVIFKSISFVIESCFFHDKLKLTRSTWSGMLHNNNYYSSNPLVLRGWGGMEGERLDFDLYFVGGSLVQFTPFV